MTKAKVDLLGLNGGRGEVARLMASSSRFAAGGMRPFWDDDGNAYISVYKGGNPAKEENYETIQVNAATLRRDEWKMLDEAILRISESRLGGVQDLINAGLTYNINGMGTTVLEWHDVSDALAAELTMDGVTRAKGDRVVFQHNYLPLPIIHADYEINARALEASRNLGNSLDTTMAERAARKVAELREQMLFTNTTYSYGEKDSRNQNTIRSYLNHPDRNQVTLTVGWDDSSTTPERILSDVLAMKQASIDAMHYGPWKLYLPTDCETVLDDDYYTAGPTRNASSNTVRERIEKISGINGIGIVDTLTTDNYLLVQMTSDVVRLVQGMAMQNIEWTTEGGMVHKYKVMTIQVPQIRSDQEGNSGIVHMA